MIFSVELPVPARELSPNSGCHWAMRHKATKAARRNAWYWFRKALPAEWSQKPVKLDVIYRYGPGHGYRPRDVQNAIASLKPHIDGMVDAKVVPDDNHNWVSWGKVDLVKCLVGETPGVRITVTACDLGTVILPEGWA